MGISYWSSYVWSFDLVLAQGFTGAGNASIGCLWLLALLQRQHAGKGHGLDGERAGDAQLVFRHRGLVVQGFRVGMGGDGVIHLALHGLARGMEGVESLACRRDRKSKRLNSSH